MIFSGRRKRQQSSPRARDGDQRRIENSNAENQQRSQKGRYMVPLAQSQLQPQRRHQETQEHRSTVAHKDLGRLEVPAQEASRSAKNGGSQRGHHNLAIQKREQREKKGSCRRKSC